MELELLNELEAQHRDAEQLLERLGSATDEAEQRTLVDQLVTALSEHMTIEEEQVYPELEQIDGELGEEAEVEHGLAREGLTKLQELIGQPGFGAAVDMVKGGISHHVEEEENEAFPKLRRALGGQGVSSDGAPSKAELYEEAKAQGIEGRSNMTKDELAEAVQDAPDQ